MNNIILNHFVDATINIQNIIILLLYYFQYSIIIIKPLRLIIIYLNCNY